MPLNQDQIVDPDKYLPDAIKEFIDKKIDERTENFKPTKQAQLDGLIELERGIERLFKFDQPEIDQLVEQGLFENGKLTPRGKRMIHHRIVLRKKQVLS